MIFLKENNNLKISFEVCPYLNNGFNFFQTMIAHND